MIGGNHNASFLAGGGATSKLIATHDWSESLGRMESWPSSLKTTVGILLHSPVPIVLLWGEDGIMIYNDAYSVFAADRHPQLLGSKVREGWPEVADFNDHVMKVGMAGGTLSYRDQELTLHRSGAPEQVFMNLDYSPVFGENGQPAGVIAFVVETSLRVGAERKVQQNEARLLFLDALGKETARSNDANAIMAITTKMTGEYLKVAICAYADMDVDQDGFTIRGDWSAPGSPSIVGHYSLADFGRLAVQNLGAGRPLVVDDNLRELAPEEAATFQDIGIASTICMPLVKEGRLRALMAIHDKVPRVWTDEELALITEVTERSWAHIERVSAEAALRAREQQLRVLAQVMPNHVWNAQPDGLLDWFNEQVYMYSGKREGELDGNGWAKIVHPEDLAGALERWTASLASGDDYEAEFRLRRYDGEYRWHLARAVALRDRAGAILRWIGTNTDVDDQKNAEGLLERRLEQRTAERDRIWRVSQDMLGVADSGGVWLSINPAWTRILGWTERELVGRTSEWLEHPQDNEATRTEIARMARGAPTSTFVNRLRAKDSSYRTFSWSATPVEGTLYCTARDITQQREQELALAAAEDQLRHAQKMEAVGQLTGGIAHDFNNLLQGIIGGLELIQRRIQEGRLNDIDRFIKAAAESAHRAAALTHRLLAFSRRQTLDPSPTDVNRLITGMEDMITRTMGPQIAIEVVGSAGLWPTKVDAPQLESALLNLCINARDAMPDGGRLTIETTNKRFDDRAAHVHELPPGQYLTLSVTDTGSGMPPDVAAKAFDPFFTTKPLGKGTGLGLSMVYGFVRQSGGQVRVYSEVGKGTTMCIYLPRYSGALDDNVSPKKEAVERGFGETVLVIDDELNVRMLVSEVLTEQHYLTLEAKDGPSAFAILESGKRIDLMITDVGLPGGLNGRQIADRARALRPKLKILFITGYAENAAISNHLEPGMSVLAKPFAMSALANKVREMLELK